MTAIKLLYFGHIMQRLKSTIQCIGKGGRKEKRTSNKMDGNNCSRDGAPLEHLKDQNEGRTSGENLCGW